MKYLKTREDAIVPTKGSAAAAGYDLYVPKNQEDIIIAPKEFKKIDTGIAIALPENSFGALFSRSGLSTKQGLKLTNGVGVIDEDYRGPVIACLYNDSNEARTIKGGDRIAQLIVIPYLPVIFEETDSLDATERNDSGFGSTGI